MEDSELEVDEGLYVARLDLNDEVDDDNQERCSCYHPTPLEPAYHAVLPRCRYGMGEECQEYHHEDILVGYEDVGQHLRIELREELGQHESHALEVGTTEEKPREADKVEGQEYGKESSDSCRMVLAVVVQDGLREELMDVDQCPVERSPDDEVKACAVPQSAQRHRHHLVEVHAHLSFAASAERDVDIVAYP